MPRPRRLNIVGIPQHVTQRGNNRQECFFDDKDRERYLTIICDAAYRRECRVHAYVLMTNHVHLLVTPAIPDGVSRLMQDVGREYVRYFNRRYRRSGTLWEGRHKSSLVDSDAYCLICYRYIELNPVRAHMVDLPQDYRWSSHAANAYGHLDGLVNPHLQWMALGDSHRARFMAFRKLSSETLRDSDLDFIRRSNRKGIVLGRSEFKKTVEAELGIKLGTGKVGRPAKIS